MRKRFLWRIKYEVKRIVLFVLVFVMLFSTVAFANETGEWQTENSLMENEGIQPRYTYIQIMSAGLTIDANGHVIFDGSVRAPYRNVRLSLYLQRSNNGLFWDNIQGGIKTVYDSGIIEYSRNVSADDYFYRAKLIVEVLDDNKNVIESETIYSDSKRY